MPIMEHALGTGGRCDEVAKVLMITQLLERGQYRIDPYVIADAIIRWAGLGPELGLASVRSETVLETRRAARRRRRR